MSTLEAELPLMTAQTTSPLPVIRRPYLDLFLISFLILFLELACIRWFGSTVVFLTFFTNIVLMATFLGMSVGCLAASRPRNYMRWVLPLTFFAVAAAMLIHNLYNKFPSLTISVGGNDQGNPQLIFFGTEYRYKDPTAFRIPMPVIAGTFFTLIAIIFVGLGQVMGRAFDAIPSRVGAYTINIFGSLVGIVAFGAASWFATSPHIWFFIAVLLCLYFIRPINGRQALAALGLMFLISISAYGVGNTGDTFWSPYYRINYTPQSGAIDTNGIAHQGMLPVESLGPVYLMPHLLNRDAGNPPFKDVLIIGAGSGNDVSAALKSGAKHVDAVEIDPIIYQIGKWDHPDHPYDDPRVSIHLDDGRSFIKKTKKHYDLISYALVDSLVLHSGYSSLRLESFLFTRQALEDIKARLKPGGVFAMYNYYRQGWVVGRLAKMAKDVFGVDPLVISMPYQKDITLNDNQRNHITFLLVGKPIAHAPTTQAASATSQPVASVPDIDHIRAMFAKDQNYWVHEHPGLGASKNAFGPIPPGTTQNSAAYYQKFPSAALPWRLFSPAKVQTDGASVIEPTDDWPFLYLRNRTIPFQPSQVGMIMIGAISLIILLAFTWPVWFSRNPSQFHGRFNWQMFFLGAGFMLLETKGVVHMALLFGATWVVNSIVFFAILVMILLANLFVITFKPRNLWPWYGLLGVSLLIGAFIKMDSFLTYSEMPRIILSCSIFFIPVFFAGVIFAASFRDSRRPDVDFGSNIAGIILGGLSEQLSLMIGFSYLLLVAMGFYFLSAIFKPRPKAIEQSAAPAAEG